MRQFSWRMTILNSANTGASSLNHHLPLIQSQPNPAPRKQGIRRLPGHSWLDGELFRSRARGCKLSQPDLLVDRANFRDGLEGGRSRGAANRPIESRIHPEGYRRTEADGAGTIRPFGEGDFRQHIQVETLDAATHEPRDDQDALAGQAIGGRRTEPRVHEETAEDEVETDKDERNAPESEENGRIGGESADLPEYSETAP